MRTYSVTGRFPEHITESGITILGLMSEGKMFRILKARQGTKFVILKTPVQQDSMSIELLRREYELSCTLSHPCIVRTLGFDESIPAIVMEYIDGKTLDEYIVTAPSIQKRKAVLQDILDAVDYLHHRGVLHNDLKPDNIIISPNGSAKIINFGLSGSDDSIYKWCPGGSDGYSAPEILAGKGHCGAASDIYSIGLLMRLIFGGNKYALIAQRCCKEDAAKRFQSIGSLRNRIRRANQLPWILALAIVLSACVFMAMQPAIEQRLNENDIQNCKSDYEDELAPLFNETVRKMQEAKSRATAEMIVRDYLQSSCSFVDSVQRLYPMTETGEIPPELFAVTAAYRKNVEILDSLLLTIPKE